MNKNEFEQVNTVIANEFEQVAIKRLYVANELVKSALLLIAISATSEVTKTTLVNLANKILVK